MQATESTGEVLAVDKPIAAYDEFRKQLSELRQHNNSVVFDYETPQGNKEARSHIYQLRKTKSAVDRVRKAEKAYYLEMGRKVDSEAKEIVAEIEDMIEVHQKPLDEIEQREADRKAKHESRIEHMRSLVETGGETAAELKHRLAELASYQIGPQWEEYEPEAERIQRKGVEALQEGIAALEKYEAEQAELEELRREKAERDRKDHEARIAQEAEQRAREEAEQREAALKRQAQEAEERAARAEQEAQERAQREAEERTRQEKEAAEKRQRDREHAAKIHREIAAAILDRCPAGSGGHLAAEQAQAIVVAMAKGQIPHVSISY